MDTTARLVLLIALAIASAAAIAAGTRDMVEVQVVGVANALARTPAGEIIATMTETRAIAALKPGEAPRVLASSYQGKPFIRPNDLTVTRQGNIYFTDVGAPNAAPGEAVNAVYMLKPDGEVAQVTTEIARPNGIALSPDERRLYVATAVGVQVFSARGEALGVIGMPGATQNLAFSGLRKAVLYVVGGGAVYRIAAETRGPRRDGK